MSTKTVTPNVRSRQTFGGFTVAALRRYSEFAWGGVSASELAFAADLAEALTTAGFDRLEQTPDGWGWVKQTSFTPSTVAEPPVEQLTRRLLWPWLRTQRSTPDTLRVDGAAHGTAWQGELADALELGGYEYAHETPDGWGWLTDTTDGGHTVIRASRTIPNLPDRQRSRPGHLFIGMATNTMTLTSPLTRLHLRQLGEALNHAGFDSPADAQAGWTFTPAVLAHDIDRTARPDAGDWFEFHTDRDEDLTAAVEHLQKHLPAHRVPDQALRTELAETSIWDLVAYERSATDPTPDRIVWTAELADALTAAGYHYLHETPDGWGWTTTWSDAGPLVEPDSVRTTG